MKSLIIFLCFATLCRAQYIEIRCLFSANGGYGCSDTEFVITRNETLTIVFVGNHVPGWSNVDVDTIFFRHPPLPFFVAEVFTTFPNIRRMNLFQGTHLNIQNGSFENARHLESLEISTSHVVLSDYALTGAANITVIQIADCETLTIGEFAFAGLRSLNTLLIFRSNLHQLQENTLSSLANLERFQLHASLVETIPANLFANNTLLRYIIMVINPINEIGRNFIDNLGQLEVLELEGNVCVSNGWNNVRQFLEDIHRELEPCYRNFDKLPRQFSLEVHGSLVIRDQNGNVVVRLLDRKSSRGMLYENEELRLRTININAEVDRGQSDIRKLRRENEQLRREIWSLRDEYDKLDKLLGGTRSRDFGNTISTNRPETEVDDNEYYSDDSNSCDTSNDEDDYSDKEEADNHQNAQKSRENLHVNFDHLSIVSEENTPNCDEVLSSTGHTRGNVTPISEFQSNIPPLAHFENIRYEEIGPSLDSSGEIQRSESTPTTGETVISVKDPLNGGHTPDVQRNSSSKGFNPFNFLKSAVKVQNRVGPADFCVSNAVATTKTYEGIIKGEPIYAQVQKGSKANGPASPGVFQRGGNLDDLLQDIELLTTDIQQMQKHNQQYHSHLSLNRLTTSNDTIPKPKSNLLQNKPFRSEMNLMLSFDGDQPKITPLVMTQDSPPPTMPNPMNLLPTTLPYIGFKEEFTRPSNDSTAPPIDPVESKENGFAMIRRRLFTKKSNVPHDTPKIVVEKPPSGLKRNDSHSSSSEPNAEVTHQKPSKPLETRRKSRRISLNLNGTNYEENSSKIKNAHSSKVIRRSSHAEPQEEIPVFLNGMNGINIPGIMNSSMKPPKHNHRKLSSDSVRTKKGRRHSDGGSLLGHDSAYEFGTSISERYSNSLESSRESSTSLNIPARKVSFGKSGGKIPWCGCWGNGCF